MAIKSITTACILFIGTTLELITYGTHITPRTYADVSRHEFSVWISPEATVHLDETQLHNSAPYFSTAQALIYRSNCQNLSLFSKYTPSAEKIVPAIHANGLLAFLAIQGTDTAQAAISCWNNPFYLHNHVQKLVDLARSSGAEGIDIDYETAYFNAKTEEYDDLRQGYISLMTDLCNSLHALNRYCSIAVIATKDGIMHRGHSHLPFIFDYSTLARICDRVEIMAYDEHPRSGTPGPIAGLPWVQEIARYAANTMPAQKVWFGIPLYGRDWVGHNSTTVKYPGAKDLFARFDVHPTYDPIQGEVTFNYGFMHQVWYPDINALRAELNIVRYYGFHPIFWSLGQEFPGTWETL